MSLRDKMLAVMADVNASVAEREELVELIAIALLTRKNLFVLAAVIALILAIAVLMIVRVIKSGAQTGIPAQAANWTSDRMRGLAPSRSTPSCPMLHRTSCKGSSIPGACA